MIVPSYWAEAKRQHRTHGKQMTVLRYGWSDQSLDDAQRMADQRADEALRRVMDGESLVRREPKVAYNGAAGVPIREEILERYGRHVVTRNAYGAHCLNTPDGLFADVDYPESSGAASILLSLALTAAAAAGVRWWTDRWGLAILAAIVVWIFFNTLLDQLRKWRGPSNARDEARAVQRVERFVATHPAWNVRVYRTTAGLRLLATHRPFDPQEPEVAEFFNAVYADRVYVQMCRNQNCFRARLTAKPWRIGITDHLRPRPGVWPVRPESQEVRREWIEQYESQRKPFASCHLIVTIGSGVTHDSLRDLIEVHDRESHALLADLPLA